MLVKLEYVGICGSDLQYYETGVIDYSVNHKADIVKAVIRIG